MKLYCEAQILPKNAFNVIYFVLHHQTPIQRELELLKWTNIKLYSEDLRGSAILVTLENSSTNPEHKMVACQEAKKQFLFVWDWVIIIYTVCAHIYYTYQNILGYNHSLENNVQQGRFIRKPSENN